MFITRVELRNIKNHAESSYTFQPGVISICGPNGSGKTTILEAIAWTLFDHLDYKREDFVRRGARKGQATVGFVSDLDEREYLVTRDTGGGYFVYDPQTRSRLVEQKNQVLPWLRQHLGVEPGADLAVLFRTTIGVPQGTFTYDFTLPPANRKATFDQILRVEEYRQAADQLRVPQRLAESRTIELERQLSRFEGELAIWDELQREYDEAGERLSRLAGDLSAGLAEKERLGAALRRDDELREELEAQRQLVGQRRVQVGTVGDRCLTARLACGQAREAAELVAGAAEGARLYLAAASELESLELKRSARDRQRAELSALEQRLVEAESVERYLAERLAEVAQARLESGRLESLALRQEDLELTLSRLREARGEALSLQTTRADLQQELNKLRSRYQALTKQIEEAEQGLTQAQSVDALEAERQQLETEARQIAILRESSQLKRGQLERLESDLQQRRLEEARLREGLSALEALTESVEGIPSLEARQQELATRRARLGAELARDQEMITALEGGRICPLLTEKCLNLGEGESLAGRFHDGLEQRRNEIVTIGHALDQLNAELKEARRVALDYARVPDLRRSLEALVVNRRADEEQAEQLRVEIGRLPGDPEALSRQLTARRSQLDDQLRQAREAQRLIHQAEILGEERARVQREGELRRTEYDRLEARLGELGEVDDLIGEVQQQLAALGDPRSRLVALRQTIDRESGWLDEVARASQLTAEIRQQADPLRQLLLSTQHLDQQLATATTNRSLHQSDYLAFIANEQMARTLDAREAELRALDDELARLEAALAAAAAALAIREAAYDQTAHQAARDRYDSCRELVSQLGAQQEHLRTRIDALTTRLAALAAIREEMKILSAERDRLSRLGRKTEMIRETLTKAAPFITEAYLYSVSHEANQLYREIAGRYDMTLRWTREYEILIEENGYERPFQNLSGGEQMAAALAVRLALLRELSEINLAIFDEPTTNMDEERRRNLALQLGRIRDFHQLFVISHDDSFEGLTDQQINLGEPSLSGRS